MAYGGLFVLSSKTFFSSVSITFFASSIEIPHLAPMRPLKGGTFFNAGGKVTQAKSPPRTIKQKIAKNLSFKNIRPILFLPFPKVFYPFLKFNSCSYRGNNKFFRKGLHDSSHRLKTSAMQRNKITNFFLF